MNRRTFCIAVASVTFTQPDRGYAQAKGLPVATWLNTGSRDSQSHYLRAFEEGLTALGWRRNQNILIEEYWAEGQMDRLPGLVKQSLEKRPAVIVAATFRAVAEAAKGAPEVPLVIANAGDPVATGFAKSLARPGGMITGLSNFVGQTSEKHLELLVAAVPGLKKVGLLFDGTALNTPIHKDNTRKALARFAVEGVPTDAFQPSDIAPAVAKMAKAGAQGLIVFPSGIFPSERRRIISMALEHRLALIAGSPDFASDGALISYGVEAVALYRRAASYVDRILKGAKPGDLPIEQPTKFELVVNLKTARALGITIPQSVLLQASRVIE